MIKPVGNDLISASPQLLEQSAKLLRKELFQPRSPKPAEDDRNFFRILSASVIAGEWSDEAKKTWQKIVEREAKLPEASSASIEQGLGFICDALNENNKNGKFVVAACSVNKDGKTMFYVTLRAGTDQGDQARDNLQESKTVIKVGQIANETEQDRSLKRLQEALKTELEKKDLSPFKIGVCYFSIGDVFRSMEEPGKAESAYLQAEKWFKKLDDTGPEKKNVLLGLTKTYLGHTGVLSLDKELSEFRKELAAAKDAKDETDRRTLQGNALARLSFGIKPLIRRMATHFREAEELLKDEVRDPQVRDELKAAYKQHAAVLKLYAKFAGVEKDGKELEQMLKTDAEELEKKAEALK